MCWRPIRIRHEIICFFRSLRGIEILAVYDPIDSIVDEAERVWEVDKEKIHRCSMSSLSRSGKN